MFLTTFNSCSPSSTHKLQLLTTGNGASRLLLNDAAPATASATAQRRPTLSSVLAAVRSKVLAQVEACIDRVDSDVLSPIFTLLHTSSIFALFVVYHSSSLLYCYYISLGSTVVSCIATSKRRLYTRNKTGRYKAVEGRLLAEHERNDTGDFGRLETTQKALGLNPPRIGGILFERKRDCGATYRNRRCMVTG